MAQPVKRTYNKILVRILLPETFDNLMKKVIMSFYAEQILQQDFFGRSIQIVLIAKL